jgi:type II secretory pathway pseudopilin PulG
MIELIAVVAIIGIIMIIGGSQISSAWKRQKLQSASTDVKVLFQRALPEMQRRNMRTFVQVGPLVTDGAAKYLPMYLIGDADQDGAVGRFCRDTGCPDLLIDQYNIVVVGVSGTMGNTDVGQEFSLSTDFTNQIQSAFWSVNSTDWTVPRVLMCDFQGRAIADVVNGRQITAPATLVLTHVDVVAKAFQPPTQYVISINPVWSVRVAKQIKDSTGTWVTQNG